MSIESRIRATAAAVCASALLAPLTAQDGDRGVVVEAAHVIVAPDVRLSGADAKLVIRGGKIGAVGAEIPPETLEGSERSTWDGATVVAGFVSPHDHLSLGGDLAETIDAYTPDLRAADAFDPFDETLEHHVSRGVTSIALAPLSKNTFAGLAAVVRYDGDRGVILSDSSYLKMALVRESLDQNRFPTSRMGAVDMIRAQFEDAQSPLAVATPDVVVLRDVLSGARKAAIHAQTHAEINCALDVCGELDIVPILIGASEAHQSIDRLRAIGASIILDPLSYDSSRRALELPRKLEEAGVPFSFHSSDPAKLRRSAALAVRSGVSRDAAIAALTRTPAEQCGIADRVGSLRSGHDADFAVFDGDPIDLSSRLLAVYVGGKRVFPSQAARTAQPQGTSR